ncbi:MAG: hypothetical protein VX589_03250 [Myxococcota bacterium]|nr:hypothetical protein [Myxococcota bacterium]
MIFILVALFIPRGQTAWGATKTPCGVPQISDSIAALHSRLIRTDSRAKLAVIADQASSRFGLKNTTANRACLAYIAGSAYFVSSSHRAQRTRYAMQAVHFLTRAQALSPETMALSQPQSRLKTAWSRLGRLKKWPLSSKTSTVILPALPMGTSIHLYPEDPAAKSEICGEDEACLKRVSLVFEGTARPTTRVMLRRGPYVVGYRTDCGERVAPTPVVLGGENPLTLPQPPACPVTVTIRDATNPQATVTDSYFLTSDGQRLESSALSTAQNVIEVGAVGYRPVRLQVKAEQREYTADLTRCEVTLQVSTTPSDAHIRGAGRGPWGTRMIEVERFGHQTEQLTFDVPRPTDCTRAKPVAVMVALKRAITVRALDARDNPVMASRLVVNGRPVSLLGFHVKPGQYTFAALHPTLGSQSGSLLVTACLEGACAPAVLTIKFKKHVSSTTSNFWSGPNTTMMAGAALLLGGLATGFAANQANNDVLSYTTKRQEGMSINERIDRRNQYALTADVLGIAGGVALLSGWLWGRAGDDEP